MNGQDGVFPPGNRRGGCASKKKARSLRSGAEGVVIMVKVDVVTLSGTDHPVCAFIRRPRSIFLMAQPPLLSEEGNTLPCNSFTPYLRPGLHSVAAPRLLSFTSRMQSSMVVWWQYGKDDIHLRRTDRRHPPPYRLASEQTTERCSPGSHSGLRKTWRALER